jgi:hypothetical protein
VKWKNSFHYIVHFQIDYSSGDTGGIEHRTQNRIHRTGYTGKDRKKEHSKVKDHLYCSQWQPFFNKAMAFLCINCHLGWFGGWGVVGVIR